MDSIPEPSSPPARIPRRTPKACKQCRASKIKCSGSRPCERCTRRRQTCVFPSAEPHVSIPESYLMDLHRRASAVPSSHSNTGNPPQGQETEQSNLAASSATLSSNTAQDEDHSLERTLASGYDQSGQAAPRDPDPPPVIPPSPRSLSTCHNADNALNGDVSQPHNPLVTRHLAYIHDTTGRPRFLGPTSTWSFCRRVVSLLEGYVASSESVMPLNLDGTAFRLRWNSKSSIEPKDLEHLPGTDFALYLYNTVKFHLGELCGLVDDEQYRKHFELFQANPWETACAKPLWFVQYLFILAFGKAFLGSGSHTHAIPGCQFAARAMSLLPDQATMHDDPILSISILALAALYFQSIDMRVPAYQYIGQALRHAYVEGLHRQVADDVINGKFAELCNTLWWSIYVLDQELTASMGSPPAIRDADLTAPLPLERSTSMSAKALTVRIRLSKLISIIGSTVYRTEEGISNTFIQTATTVLQQLADISRQLDEVVSSFNSSTPHEIPHMFRHITLFRHHCIVLTTRPLVMWLLLMKVQSANTEPEHLPVPVATLLQKSAESATAIAQILKAMAEHDMLESFLPFQLDHAFSAAMLLSILSAVLPSYIPDPSWISSIYMVLDEMISKRNVVARLRKAELEQLHTLLNPLRQNLTLAVNAPDVSGPTNAPIMSEDDFTNFDITWDSLNELGGGFLANPDEMLRLASELGTNGMDGFVPSF